MIGTKLDHYRITGKLGEGGMGVVYRAHDERLDRDVAIKVLPAEFAQDPERSARFAREARAVAALSHPNIVAIHDYGMSGELAYAVMELLEGRTLDVEIAERAPLPADLALDLALRMAGGLAAAHEKGIIHRDLKPQNVFLTGDGQLKILDFGLARSLPGAMGATLAMETRPDAYFGTIAYSAPERLSASAHDHRSDLFSFGLILCEMISGRHPFQRGYALETVSAILRDAPEIPAGIHPGLAALIGDCLQKSPDARIGSARETERRLRSCLSVPEGASVDAARTTYAIDSLAVLPFHNEADDKDVDYLIDGLTDSLIDNLSHLPKLKVLARSTVFSRRDMHEQPREAGAQLGVRAVLSGRLQRRGEILVIRAELVDVQGGQRLWGGRFNRPVGDFLQIEDEICGEITENLRFRLSREEKDRVAKRYTESPEAHEAYLKGRYVWNRWKTPEAMRTAIGFFERAIALDPLYARAYAGLADSYSILGNLKAVPPSEAYPRAKTACEQGLAIDDGLAELHSSLAFIQRFWDWDWPASRRSFERAIQLNPGYATAHRFYSHLLASLGEHEAAIARARHALELDPLSPILLTAVGDAYFYARRYDEAMDCYRKCIELDPGFLAGHTDLARSLELAGRCDEAIAEHKLGQKLAPEGPPDPSAGLAHVFARMGRREEALSIVQDLIALSARRYVSPYGIASIYANLGENASALDWLEKAYAEHDQTLVWVKVHPRLDGLRDEPGYQALLTKMRL